MRCLASFAVRVRDAASELCAVLPSLQVAAKRHLRDPGRGDVEPSEPRQLMLRAYGAAKSSSDLVRGENGVVAAASVTPSLGRGGKDLASSGNGNLLLAGRFQIRLAAAALPERVGRRRETTRCVAGTVDVSGMCLHVLRTDNNKMRFAGTLLKAL